LPPVDAQLQRNEAVSAALKGLSLGGDRVHLDSDDLAPLRKMVERPREHARTIATINAYEDWLYPTKRRPYVQSVEELAWEPWHDFYTQPPPWEQQDG
jgi:hypothetical protein